MGRYDPWMELNRLYKLQMQAHDSGDETTEYDCKLERGRIEREICAQNLSGLRGRSTSAPRKATLDRDAHILALLAEKPLPVCVIARQINEEIHTARSIMKRLRRQGEVVYHDGVWELADE